MPKIRLCTVVGGLIQVNLSPYLGISNLQRPVGMTLEKRTTKHSIKRGVNKALVW